MLLNETSVTAELAQAIHRVTNGDVPRELLRPDLWDKTGETGSLRTPYRVSIDAHRRSADSYPCHQMVAEGASFEPSPASPDRFLGPDNNNKGSDRS